MIFPWDKDNRNKSFNEIQKDLDNIKTSGFFELPIDATCRDLNHNPPTHLYIPPGKGYRHICPKCKKEIVIIPQQITL